MSRFKRYEPTADITISERDAAVLKDTLRIQRNRLVHQLEHPLTQESDYLKDFFADMIAVHDVIINDIEKAQWVAQGKPG